MVYHVYLILFRVVKLIFCLLAYHTYKWPDPGSALHVKDSSGAKLSPRLGKLRFQRPKAGKMKSILLLLSQEEIFENSVPAFFFHSNLTLNLCIIQAVHLEVADKFIPSVYSFLCCCLLLFFTMSSIYPLCNSI